MLAPNPCKVLMVFPRFTASSFWSMQAACDMWGAKCTAPPLGLITLAALLPASWTLKLVNCNAEELTDADIDWADMVMTGGMLPQRFDTLEIIDRVQARGKIVVIGGPDAMSSPEVYEKAEFRVLGEAEGLIDHFVTAWMRGERSGTFEAERFKANVAESPIPRFDLLNFKHYLYVGVQFSRGCPFTCEFCDIIELYGRVPRTKTNAQMLRELDCLYEAGYRGHVDFVDDNLIGNKKAIKLFLPHLIEWQQKRGYPYNFTTEASINLADDDDLLAMMKQANFFGVFVGIESPDTETLVQAQKKQNTRRSLAESVHKIYDAGIFVLAGFIVGFDTEKGSMAKGMVDCIEDTGIPVAMVGLLTALPSTQLSRRLEKEGRLLPLETDKGGDQCTAGLNFVTLRPRSAILRDYRDVLDKIYSPEAFYERVRRVGLAMNREALPGQKIFLKPLMRDLKVLSKLCIEITFRRPDVRRMFWTTTLTVARHNFRALEFMLFMMVMYLHLGRFSRHVMSVLETEIAEQELIEATEGVARPLSNGMDRSLTPIEASATPQSHGVAA